MLPQPITNDSPLPWEQHEYPGKRPVDDVRLHARRESVFLVLAGGFLVAAALLPVLGLVPALDWSLAVPQLGLELPVAVPLGLLAFPLTFFCVDLLVELFGPRRALLLAVLGSVLAALAFAVVAAGRGFETALLASGGGLLAFGAAAHLVHLGTYALVRRLSGGRHLWLRHLVATAAGVAAGGLVLTALAGARATLLAALPYAAAAVLVGAPLLYLVGGWLGVYLRLPLAHQEARHSPAPLPASASAEPV